MATNFPEIINTRALRKAIDGAFEWMVITFGESLEIAFLPVLQLLNWIENLLIATPWWIVLAALAGMGWLASRSWKIALSIAAMVFAMGFLGLWDAAMTTIALMLTATFLAVLIGLPIGVAMSRSDFLQSVTLPVLDIMQTLPIFVYLIPFVMLFGPGKIPALLATIVFAVPPMIRLTNLGIRQVDEGVMEAVTSFGTTPRQRLFTVQLPLALPTIMAGINQTTMMALSMVVIASMIGAGGLGYQVLQGIQRLEVSRGLLAGLGIVFLAIIIDRIAQSYGRRVQQHLHLSN
ncbi:MAG: ABC transporter permease [Burkholderiaceae bacterium]